MGKPYLGWLDDHLDVLWGDTSRYCWEVCRHEDRESDCTRKSGEDEPPYTIGGECAFRRELAKTPLTGEDAYAFAILRTCKFPSIYMAMSEVRAVVPIVEIVKAAEILDIPVDESLLETIASAEDFIRAQDNDRAKQKADNAAANTGRINGKRRRS